MQNAKCECQIAIEWSKEKQQQKLRNAAAATDDAQMALLMLLELLEAASTISHLAIVAKCMPEQSE